jgi:phosphoribosylformimino-5-aminoimidazole carboxamide ribonucleotide (ProFAR) isomerase
MTSPPKKKAEPKKTEKKVAPKKSSQQVDSKDYGNMHFCDLPTCKDGTPRKKALVLWIIEKVNASIPKSKRKKGSL